MPLLYRRGQLSATLGALRVGVGTTMLVRPMLLPRPLGVDRITSQRVSWLVRMAGARDVALGVGTLLASRQARSSENAGGLTNWLVLGAACDAVDALALGRATVRGDVGPVMGTLAALSGAGGVILSAAALAETRTSRSAD